jgi:peptidoglycan/LPS O-acetylase OafA/YrhL
MKKNSNYEKIYALESLRGIAALLIALFHYPSSSFLFFEKGFYAVNFFFILSGFVISYNYADRIKNLSDLIQFQIKRFYRLYPVHLFVLGLILLIQTAKYLVIEYTDYSYGSEAFGSRYTIKDFFANLLLVHSIFNFSYWLSWNPASWSISTEFYTYIIFALIFLLFKNYKFILILIFVILFSSIFIDKYNYFSLTDYNSLFNGVFFQCLFNFGNGCVVYFVFSRIKFFFNDLLSISVLIFIFVIYYFYNKFFYQYNFLVFSLIILIFSKLNRSSYVYRIINIKPLVFLGTISYSFYMIHESIIYLLIQSLKFIFKIEFILEGKTAVHTLSSFTDTWITLLYILLSILTAYGMHRFIELRFRKNKS